MWPMHRENPDKIRNPLLAAVCQPEVKGCHILVDMMYVQYDMSHFPVQGKNLTKIRSIHRYLFDMYFHISII